MGKTVKDVADLLNVFIDQSKTQVPPGGYTSAITATQDNIKVGTLDPDQWRMGDAFVKPVPEAIKQIVPLLSLVSIQTADWPASLARANKSCPEQNSKPRQKLSREPPPPSFIRF